MGKMKQMHVESLECEDIPDIDDTDVCDTCCKKECPGGCEDEIEAHAKAFLEASAAYSEAAKRWQTYASSESVEE